MFFQDLYSVGGNRLNKNLPVIGLEKTLIEKYTACHRISH